MKSVIVFGGYGTFGSHVCRALAARGLTVTVAGRNEAKAIAFARKLGTNCLGLLGDVSQKNSCRRVVPGHAVAVNCSGPFQHQQSDLLEVCLEAGCHYADIADDRTHARLVRSFDTRFREKGLAAIHGCSSLPGISGALAHWLVEGKKERLDRARITLFIGNRNPKGSAAVRSLLAGLGQPISAPQGAIRGFRDREVVPLPAPFGPRSVFNFESPEYDLFPSELGTPSVSVKVGFELPWVNYAFALLAMMGTRSWEGLAPLLEIPGRLFERFGRSGAAIMTELFFRDGSIRRAAMVASSDGQRLAALPCALAVFNLLESSSAPKGAMTVYELLGASPLLSSLIQEGFTLFMQDGSAATWKQRPLPAPR